MKDISDRLTSIGEQVSEERLRSIVETQFQSLAGDEKFVRKMRFGGDADEKLATSKYARHGLNAADIEFLYDLQSSLAGKPKRDGGIHTGPSDELSRAFKAVSDAYYLSDEQIREIDRRAIDDLFPRIPKAHLRASGFKNMNEARDAAMRAATMDTGQSGFGQQLVGAQYSGDLWDAAFQESRVSALIPTFEMTAPTAYLPVAVDMPEPLFVSESTSDVLATAQYATVRTGSQRVQVDAKKFVIHQVWSAEMEEDSIIPFIPYLRKQAALALGFYTDSLVLNGDNTNAGTGNINLDDADPADTKYYLAFDGIRHAALVDNTANGIDVAGALTLNTFRDLRTRMKDGTRFVDWGHPNRAEDLVFVADPDTADRAALLDEVISAKIQNGSNANLLTGQISSILGHPLISTMAQPLTEADGKVSTTANNNVKGQITAFNRNGFVLGWRRRVRVATEQVIASDQMRIVYTFRLGFGRFTPSGAASGIEAAAVGYDISL